AHPPGNLMLPQPLHGLLAEAENTARVGDQAFPRGREIDPRRRAGEELEPELVLESLDLRADGRLRAMEQSPPRRQGALIGDGEEGLEKVGIELRDAHDGP